MGGDSTAVEQEQRPTIKSFKTAQGSIYTYDEAGKTTRWKTATREQMPRQDLTVFIKLDPDEEQEVIRAYRHARDEDKGAKVYVLERQLDNTTKMLRDVSEVTNPNQVYIAVLREGKYTLLKKASLTPTRGDAVFDTRHFQENGQEYTERHLGNKVVEIEEG